MEHYPTPWAGHDRQQEGTRTCSSTTCLAISPSICFTTGEFDLFRILMREQPHMVAIVKHDFVVRQQGQVFRVGLSNQ
mgnify:CR=1 FL=1